MSSPRSAKVLSKAQFNKKRPDINFFKRTFKLNEQYFLVWCDLGETSMLGLVLLCPFMFVFLPDLTACGRAIENSLFKISGVYANNLGLWYTWYVVKT